MLSSSVAFGSPNGSVVFCEIYTVADPQLMGNMSCSSTLKYAACFTKLFVESSKRKKGDSFV